jgi:F-type H+-transporting ATPase subunit a
MAALHISIAAETITKIARLPVTNSLISTWAVMGVLILFALVATSSLKMIPGTFQVMVEMLIGGLYDFFEGIVGKDKIKTFFPLLATFFLFILFANWSGLIPLGAIGIHKTVPAAAAPPASEVTPSNVNIENNTAGQAAVVAAPTQTAESETEFVPLFRGPTADLNTTLALALISVGSMLYFGVRYLGMPFFKRYVDLSNPIMTFVGFLEITSDVSKILSFAFRLFGNIFAGEVLLAVMAYLPSLIKVPVVSTGLGFVSQIPFLGLELFVGIIQALVFAMLSAVFWSIATTGHGGEAAAEAH